MTIHYHPTDKLVLDFAAGTIDPVLGLAVASHVALCNVCRAHCDQWEKLGGARLAKLPPAAIEDDALSRALERIDTPEPPAGRVSPDSDPILPPPLRRFSPIRRRWVAPGMWAQPLAKDAERGTHAYLLGAVAAKRLPRHRHRGLELVCVLKGCLLDGQDQYKRGDLLQADESVVHGPAAGPDEECICVLGSFGLPRGPMGWLLSLVV